MIRPLAEFCIFLCCIRPEAESNNEIKLHSAKNFCILFIRPRYFFCMIRPKQNYVIRPKQKNMQLGQKQFPEKFFSGRKAVRLCLPLESISFPELEKKLVWFLIITPIPELKFCANVPCPFTFFHQPK